MTENQRGLVYTCTCIVCVHVFSANTVYAEILPGEKLRQFRHLLLLVKFLSREFLCPVLMIALRMG